MAESFSTSHSAQARTSPACRESVETLANRRNSNKSSSSALTPQTLHQPGPKPQPSIPVSMIRESLGTVLCRQNDFCGASRVSVQRSDPFFLMRRFAPCASNNQMPHSSAVNFFSAIRECR
jgi:hypothetical protein